MKKLLWLMLLIAFPSYADFSPGQCGDLHSNDEFAAWFELDPATSSDTILATKRNGSQPVPIWSNDSAINATINDSETQPGTDYQVVLTYRPLSTNKMGILSYYLLDNGVWKFIESKQADLTDLSAAIAIDGAGAVDSLQCSDDIELPPLPPSYSTNAKYEFGVKQCTSMPCTINFTQDYDLAPLVFVMPTVRTNNPDGDAPSRLLITSVLDENSTGVTITQDSLPNLRNSFETVPMTEISYFVIEPGVVEIDGHKMVAGYVDTAKSIRRRGTVNEEIVPFSRFGGDGFTSTPVVLHQLQTNHNDDAWMTSGRRDVGNQLDETRLFIELSDTGSDEFDDEIERIAFLAAEPSGKLNTDSYAIQFGRFDIVAQNGSASALIDGCNGSIASTSLTNLTGIIGNKQQRRGSDGGWLRRCEMSGNQASFAMDEDMANRTHIWERGGFLAFETTFELDACDFFPSALQTNSYYQGLPFASQIAMSGDRNKIYLENRAPVSFNNIPVAGRDSGCVYGSGTNPETCLFDPTLSYDDPANGITYPLVLPAFKVGTTMVNCTNGCSRTLAPGEYASITVGNNSSIVTLNSGVYWVDTLNMSGNDAELRVNGVVVIHYRRLNVTGDRVKLNANPGADFKNLYLVGHDSNAVVRVSKNDFHVKGNLYIDSINGGSQGLVYQGQRLDFEGAISAQEIQITNNDNRIAAKAPKICGVPPVDDLTWVVEPQYQFALTCERVPVLFKTVDENGVITQPSDSSFSATANPASSSQWCESDTGGTCSTTGQDYSSSLVNGQKTLYLSARTLQQYLVEGTWNSNTESGTTSIRFVPFKFAANNINVIAGKSYDQTVRVMACDDNSTETVSYSGTPTTEWNVELPVGGNAGTAPTFAPSFTEQGSVITTIKINESGQFKVTLQDTSFECSEIAGCPESGIGNLAGSFTVKSRPWTFAICPSSDAGGDSTSGSGFVPAREAFALNAKPVVWSSSLSGNASDGTALRLRQKEASSNAFCSLSTTSNFYINDSETNVAASLSHSLATPTAGIAGTMSYDGPVDNHSSSSELPFTGISVTEVGSFHFAVDASNSFYNAIEGGIETGARELGRFYPRYFRAVGEDWDYFGGQNFNYMNQNFEQVSFDVEALSGGTTPQAVENYQHFAPAMQARFNLYDDDQPERLIFPDFGAATWQGTNQSIGRFSALPSGHCSDSNLTSLCWVKADAAIGYEDGPFNLNGTTTNPTDIRLTLESGPDPVEYWDSGELLTTQPDLRFGRVALDSLGSTVNTTLNIPLRVEFWNGERFVVNSDDDAVSTILGESTSTNNNNIWVEEGQTAETLSFDNGGLVNDGESDSITVTHSSQVRQQTQIWLELDNTDNDMPWLRYNWDDDLASDDANGEQDPSSVVTFGIYRGNDRVIFRGEPGLIGQ
jgi:hypothetical protein